MVTLRALSRARLGSKVKALEIAQMWCYGRLMNEKQITQLQEDMAHLTRTVEDLSDIVARLDTENGLLKHRLEMLMQREAEREAQSGGSAVMTDQRPPHW